MLITTYYLVQLHGHWVPHQETGSQTGPSLVVSVFKSATRSSNFFQFKDKKNPIACALTLFTNFFVADAMLPIMGNIPAFKGCVRYILATLFFKSKRDHL